MQFKDFITRQRVTIAVVGVATFIVSLVAAHFVAAQTLWRSLFVDLAASAMTIIFTSLIIDYLGQKEQSVRTQNAAELAEDEIRACCSRIKWRIARLFGLQTHEADIRETISTKQEARHYLEAATKEVDEYLQSHSLTDTDTPLQEANLSRYIERLQTAQNELEQTLLLYEYALSYSLRERILALRRELQTADRILGFIDSSDSLTENNRAMIRVTAQSVYDATVDVLDHDSRSATADTIHGKELPTI